MRRAVDGAQAARVAREVGAVGAARARGERGCVGKTACGWSSVARMRWSGVGEGGMEDEMERGAGGRDGG